jgi:hypothetical protein
MKNNTLHHFGASFAVVRKSKNFGNYIADDLGINYINYAKVGCSNEEILHEILDAYNNIKPNDIVLINFSRLSRSLMVTSEGTFKSTNTLLNDANQTITNEGLQLFRSDNGDILNYFIKYNYDYNFKLFTLITKILSNLEKNGIKIYYVFVKKEKLYYGSQSVSELNYESIGKNQLIFKPNYHQWLVNNNWHNNEDIHYTDNIQKELADEYIKRINGE